MLQLTQTLLAALALLVFTCSSQAAGKVDMDQPLPRIEVGQHTSLIRNAATDPERELLYTAADDKTIRVWQLPELTPLRVLRVPIAEGHEGQIFGLDISPDGKTVAAAGWTGWDIEGKASIYLLNANNGAMVGRISNLPQGISTLKFLGKSTLLAVGLMGNGGFRIIDISSQTTVFEDREYSQDIRDIDISPSGHIAVAGLDHFIRLYSPDFALIARVKPTPTASPAVLKFAPDEHTLAVGFHENADVFLLNPQNLGTQNILRTGAHTQASNATVLDWLHNSNSNSTGHAAHLCMSGEPLQTKSVKVACLQIRQAKPGDATEHSQFSVGPSRLNVLLNWKQNLLLGTEAPSLLITNRLGQTTVVARSSVLNFEGMGKQFKISADAKTVQYTSQGSRDEPVIKQLFDLNRSELRTPERRQTQATRLHPPASARAGNRLDTSDPFRPVLNGLALETEPFERTWHHAWAHDGQTVLLGTEWALRHYTRAGKLLWSTRLSAVAWAVNLSQNGRWAVVAMSDGTIRWFSTATGKEHLAYFQHANRSDWIAWQPSGHYMSSASGDRFLGWHMNRGLDQSPDFFLAIQFERTLYQPDQVRQSLSSHTSPVQSSQLKPVLPPRLALQLDTPVQRNDGHWVVTARIQGESLGPELKNVTVFVNEIPITAPQERPLGWFNRKSFTRQVELVLSERFNQIRVEAMTPASLGLSEHMVALPLSRLKTGAQPTPPGDLYVFAVGVSEFPQLGEEEQLEFAATDAIQFANLMKEHGQRHYRKTHVRLLADRQEQLPKKANIESALSFLSNARAQDTVIIFLASHAMQDTRGNYYFAPADAQTADVDRLRNPRPETEQHVPSMLSWDVLFDALRNTAGRRLLIVDTCHARGMEGKFESFSLIKRSVSSSFPMLLASASDEYSQEYEPARRGLFTHALLSGLQKVGRSGQALTVQNWFEQTAPTVERLRDKTAGSQTPQLIGTPRMRSWKILGL